MATMSTSAELASMLLPEEKPVWTGRPHRTAYSLSGWPLSVFGALFLILPAAAWIAIAQGRPLPSAYAPETVRWALAPWLAIGMLLVLTPLWKAWTWHRVAYLLTARRALFAGPPPGAAVTSVQLAHVRSVALHQGLFDRRFGTGSLRLWTGETYGFDNPRRLYRSFESVADPYRLKRQIEELLQRASSSS